MLLPFLGQAEYKRNHHRDGGQRHAIEIGCGLRGLAKSGSHLTLAGSIDHMVAVSAV